MTFRLNRMLADLFPGRERRHVLTLLVVSTLAAALETLGVASVYPFMALALESEAIDRFPVLRESLSYVGIQSPSAILIAFGAASVFLVVAANGAGALNIRAQQQFQARAETRIRTELFTGYLRLPYSFHVRRDSPSLLKVLNIDVPAVVANAFLGLATAISRLATVIGIAVLLIWQDPVAALSVAAFVCLAYYFVYRVVRSRQLALGVEGDLASAACVRISQEGLGAVKELKILGRLSDPAERYADASAKLAQTRSRSQMLSQLPRYALESMVFGAILIVMLIQLAAGGADATKMVPVLALYAFAGQRLMPAMQQLFVAIANVQFSLPALRSVHHDYVAIAEERRQSSEDRPSTCVHFSGLTSALEFRRVSFQYPGGQRPALREVSLCIGRRESVGLVGRTGSGKSTLADLVMGLYPPTEGEIVADGIPLSGTALKEWRKHVGYVSQHVFLSNASVLENIALGVPKNQIDVADAMRAAVLAQADEFVKLLPNGYDTFVGERGVKLSGGQRQRLGIARALYHNPEVLIFDEATSALDNLTEEAVMDAIRRLQQDRTIIVIAHRLRTVQACDRLLMLEEGRLIDQGSYDDLLRRSISFRQLVGPSSEAQLRSVSLSD